MLTSEPFKKFFKDIVQPKKRGGFRGVPFEPFRLPTQSLMLFLNTERANLLVYISKNHFQRLVKKKRGVPFYVMFATKNLKAHCDVALLLLVEDP
jgi:hypothetical protein